MADTFTPEQISQILEEFFKVVGTRQYIGARYVPIFGRKDETSIEWDNSAPYEPLTIVLYQGNSYTSRQFVPVGVEITNQEFWAITGNYNAQVEQYRRETAAAREVADNALAAANAAQTDIDTLLPKADFSAENTVKKYVDDSVAAVQTDIDTLLPKADFSAENTVKKYVDTEILRSKKPFVFNTVAEMQNYAQLYAGDICHTNGFHASGDGGAAWYVISDSGAVNGMDVIACGATLRANLVITDAFVTPEMFGAYGDGMADDTEPVRMALHSNKQILLKNNYIITHVFGNVENAKIDGCGTGKIIIADQIEAGEFIINFTGQPTIKNITFEKTFDGVENRWGGIEFSHTSFGIIDNCQFINDRHTCNGFPDIYADNHNLSVTNCLFYIDTTVNGVTHAGCVNVREQAGGNSDNIKFSNCTFKACSDDEIISPRVGNLGGNLNNTSFVNCIFEMLKDHSAAYMITGKNAYQTKYIGCTFIYNSAVSSDIGNHYFYGEVEGSSKFLDDDSYKAFFDSCIFSLIGNLTSLSFTSNNYIPRAFIKNSIISAESCSLSGCALYSCNVKINNTQPAAGSCLWVYDSDITINNNYGVIANALMEIENSTFTIIASDADNYLFYQPYFDTHFILKNSTIELPHSLLYMGNATAGDNPVIQLSNNVIKAVRGTFGQSANPMNDSYIVNCIWDGFTPTIPDTYRTHNNAHI